MPDDHTPTKYKTSFCIDSLMLRKDIRDFLGDIEKDMWTYLEHFRLLTEGGSCCAGFIELSCQVCTQLP